MKPTARVQDTSIGSLCQRLDRLEKENRRLKRLVLGVGLMGAALFSMGQTLPTGVPKVIEAEKFILKDANGKERAWLQMKASGPDLTLARFSKAGEGKSEASHTSIGAASLYMFVSGEQGDVEGLMGPGGVFFSTSKNDQEEKVNILAMGPLIEIKDKQGFRTVIGSTELESKKTGESRKTSASSITIFDKSGTVIWKAPLP